MSRTALLPVGLLALCVVPLAFAAPWPLCCCWCPWRVAALGAPGRASTSPTTALTVRSLVGERRVPWTELAGIRVGPRGDLWLVTTGGTQVRLPVMRARDLPRLAELSGGRIDVPRARRRLSSRLDDVHQRLPGQDPGQLVGDRRGGPGVGVRAPLPPTCGVSSRPGADHSGWPAGSGSGSVTSSAARSRPA